MKECLARSGGGHDGVGNIDGIGEVRDGEDDRAGFWERPSSNFFVKKNCGAEAELLVSSAWSGDDHGADMGEKGAWPSLRSKRERERREQPRGEWRRYRGLRRRETRV
jgi:hypothetical protein